MRQGQARAAIIPEADVTRWTPRRRGRRDDDDRIRRRRTKPRGQGRIAIIPDAEDEE